MRGETGCPIQLFRSPFLKSRMDYEKLLTILPKPPSKWTVSDLELWLSFIGLEALYPSFKKAAIDGSCLPSLSEQDLRNELEIKSSITVKKLMNWINVGLKEYSTYLTSLDLSRSQPPLNALKSQTLRQQEPILKPEPILLEPPPKDQQFTTLEKPGPEQARKQRFELVLRQTDGPTLYMLKEDGGSIGRHSLNQIVIPEESISRYHAKIEFKDGEFYIRDVGSTTGTFLKVEGKLEIVPEMLIEMGSSCFRIVKCDEVALVMLMVEGDGESEGVYEFKVFKNLKVTIGRKLTNSISFPDDQHLSSNHATITEQNGRLYLEDLKTTNGTWLRLSPETQQSQIHMLINNTVFRLGTTHTFACVKSPTEVIQKANPNACAVCLEQDRDCLFLPCRHFFACMGCSTKYPECQICGTKIDECQRVFRC